MLLCFLLVYLRSLVFNLVFNCFFCWFVFLWFVINQLICCFIYFQCPYLGCEDGKRAEAIQCSFCAHFGRCLARQHFLQHLFVRQNCHVRIDENENNKNEIWDMRLMRMRTRMRRGERKIFFNVFFFPFSVCVDGIARIRFIGGKNTKTRYWCLLIFDIEVDWSDCCCSLIVDL